MSEHGSVLIKRRSWLLLTALILSTAAFILGSPMLLLFAAMSGMGSDSCAGWPAYLFVLAGVTLPVAIIGVLVNGWNAFFVRNEPRAWWGFLTLVLWPLAVFISVRAPDVC